MENIELEHTSPNHLRSVRDVQIQDAQSRVIDRIRADPARARSTITTSGRVNEGLVCEVRQGKFRTVMDLGRAMGGDASAPSPGFFGRAAIAGCVAIAIKMLAAREGLHFIAVDVDVETDFDDAAIFGIGSTSAAPLDTRLTIAIETNEAETRVSDVVDRALEADPWFLALRDPQVVTRQVSTRWAGRVIDP